MVPLKDLLLSLRKKAGFEVIDVNDKSPTQLRLLGRIPADGVSLNINNWKILMFRLMTAMDEGRPWTVDFSRWYFIKKETGKLVYAWRVLFQVREGVVAEHFADLANIVNTSPQSSRTEVTEIVLPGAGRDRNNPAGGRRGAGPAGTVPVGPMAVQRKMMGG